MSSRTASMSYTAVRSSRCIPLRLVMPARLANDPAGLTSDAESSPSTTATFTDSPVLCHPIALHGVTVDLTPTDDTVEITATVRTAEGHARGVSRAESEGPPVRWPGAGARAHQQDRQRLCPSDDGRGPLGALPVLPDCYTPSTNASAAAVVQIAIVAAARKVTMLCWHLIVNSRCRFRSAQPRGVHAPRDAAERRPSRSTRQPARCGLQLQPQRRPRPPMSRRRNRGTGLRNPRRRLATPPTSDR